MTDPRRLLIGESRQECPTCGAPAELDLVGTENGEAVDHPTLEWRYRRAPLEPAIEDFKVLRARSRTQLVNLVITLRRQLAIRERKDTAS